MAPQARALVIVGAGGQGREALDTVEALNAAAPAPVWRFLGFVADDDRTADLLAARGASVLGPVARLADGARGQLPESEHGWIHRDDLMKELAIEDLQLLNLWVYRARQQLAQLKLRGAAKVIERREGAGQLRLGLRHLRVIDA